MAVKLYRGDTWTRAWELKDAAGNPIDLTGASARLQVRDATGAVVISASTTDGRLTLTPASGRIDMLVPYAATGIAPGSYRLDLEVTHANGLRRTYEQDTLIVLEDMTRD
jgi:hypothetical protein